MPPQDDVQRHVTDPRDEPWAGPETSAGSWLSEQIRLIAIEEGFADLGSRMAEAQRAK